MASPQLLKAIKVANAHPNLQQFGQSHDDAVWDGTTACTHTICQYLALLWTGKFYTLNQVNSMAGMPYRAKNLKTGQPRGMRADELARFFKVAGIPMVIKYDIPAGKLLAYTDRGPVFYGMRYGSAPEWKGTIYHGVTAKPPFAIVHGKTQLTGFEDGRHAVCLLGAQPIYRNGRVIRFSAYRKEPNHGSAARPERPPYDVITTGQFRKEYEDYHDRLGQRLYAAIPTRTLPA